MLKPTLLIADLHLSPDDKKSGLFIHFCQTTKARQLFILGDLFDIWLGDDLSVSHHQRVIAALNQLSSRCLIYLMVGNRDFLVGEKFVRLAGVKMIDEPYQITINEQKYLLMHGDLLCTKDKNYQRFRRIVRHPLTIKILKSLKRSTRHKIGNFLRKKSTQLGSQKAAYIMDVDQYSVDSLMKNYTGTDLIHGHTHKQAIHTQIHYRRFVLGNWQDTLGNALVLDELPPHWLAIMPP